MTSPVSVRQATAADAPQLSSLRWSHAAEHGDPLPPDRAGFEAAFVSFVRQAIESKQWAIWVSELRGRLVGTVYVRIVDKVPRPHRLRDSWGYVTAVYVEPSERDSGVGTELTNRVIGWARDQGMELLLLWPSAASVVFYERLGFIASPEAMELPLRA